MVQRILSSKNWFKFLIFLKKWFVFFWANSLSELYGIYDDLEMTRYLLYRIYNFKWLVCYEHYANVYESKVKDKTR